MNRDGTRAAGAIRFRQVLPHSRIDGAVRVSVENSVALKHETIPLKKSIGPRIGAIDAN